MSKIVLLDDNTIDKIAAGEVVESPKSVVKELIENAMDAGATAINVEIKNGGKSFIRITDNGQGISFLDIPNAFLRHATSKIKHIDDLESVLTMGFRGEALASIASVSQVELITKTEDSLLGYHYEINGGKPSEIKEIGAPNGTTIIVRNLFYNTPARLKFLKADTTEGNYISDILEHLALARPDISFTFINNGKTKFQTTGKNDLKDVIYRIYGREVSTDTIPISYEYNGISINGYLGKPSNNRPNRNYENYFINRRFVQSKVLCSSIEESYKEYLMQHKFPFCVLHLEMDPSKVDVNVHPAKLEVRFHDRQAVYEMLRFAVTETLHNSEMIANVTINPMEREVISINKLEPFETRDYKADKGQPLSDTSRYEDSRIDVTKINLLNNNKTDIVLFDDEDDDNGQADSQLLNDANTAKDLEDEKNSASSVGLLSRPVPNHSASVSDIYSKINIDKGFQYSFIEEDRVLSKNSRKDFKVVGQVFDTFWLITYKDSIYFIDQHAAHEKVNYERLVKRVENNNVCSQILNPPIIVTLLPKESAIMEENISYFDQLGFEIEELGQREYALRSVPLECYNNSPKDLFLDIVEQLANGELSSKAKTPDAILKNIATYACKASVKGNMSMSYDEINSLIDELLTLDNPYHCPHGRPTIFSMTRYELEKKFKRIV